MCSINVDEFAIFSSPTDSQWRRACCVTCQCDRILFSYRHVGTAQSIVDAGRNYKTWKEWILNKNVRFSAISNDKSDLHFFFLCKSACSNGLVFNCVTLPETSTLFFISPTKLNKYIRLKPNNNAIKTDWL